MLIALDGVSVSYSEVTSSVTDFRDSDIGNRRESKFGTQITIMSLQAENDFSEDFDDDVRESTANGI